MPTRNEADGADDGDDHFHPVGYLAFRRVDEALLILMSLPFAPGWRNMVPVLAGLPYVSGDRKRVYHIPAGVAAEFGVVMLMYLRQRH